MGCGSSKTASTGDLDLQRPLQQSSKMAAAEDLNLVGKHAGDAVNPAVVIATDKTKKMPTSGLTLINNSLENRGAAFTKDQRKAFGLQGLIPPRIFTLDEQVARFRVQFKGLSVPLDKYKFLMDLQVTVFNLCDAWACS